MCIRDKYISDSVPLYKKEYTWEDCSYDEGDIDMLLSTIVILNKLDAGEDVSKSVSWIKAVSYTHLNI